MDHPHVPDRRDTAVPFVAGNYDIEEGPVRPNAAEKLIRELGPNQIVTSDLRYQEFSAKGNKDVAYRNWIGSNGLLVCWDNFKKKDTNAPPVPWPSDMLWEQWLRGNRRDPHQRVSDLQYVFRSCIIEEATAKLIWLSASHGCYKTNCRGPNNQVEYTEQDSGFFAIIGSVNGGSLMKMLTQHKDELNYRKVVRVVVLGKPGLTMTEPENRSVLFVCRIAVLRTVPLNLFLWC